MEGDDEFNRFVRVLDDSKNHLLKLDGHTRLEVLRVLIKNPKFDETDVYYLTAIALQDKSNSSIPCDHVEGVRDVSVGGEREERLPRDESLHDPPCLTLEAETRMREEVANPGTYRSKKAKREKKSVTTENTSEAEAPKPKKLRITMKSEDKSEKICEKDEDEEEEKVTVLVPELQPPELPENFKGYIKDRNGCELVLVIQKQLFSSDINKNSGRFSLPINQIRADFLRANEKTLLSEHMGIEAKIIFEPPENEITEASVRLKKWDMRVCSVYNIVSGWKHVVEKNRCEKGMMVQLWSFRVEEKLWFALVKVATGDVVADGN